VIAQAHAHASPPKPFPTSSRSGEYEVLEDEPLQALPPPDANESEAERGMDVTCGSDDEVDGPWDDLDRPPLLPPPPAVFESMTPFLTELVAQHYNSPEIFVATPGPELDVEDMRKQLERLW